ncbi:hypothetical protein [Pelagicoccus albus]|uniref:Uncharacterized protein n=1 Tax=Pelagicoccus albus TaxID=415222 RepID=A0A7X1E8C7_9BACT|nr:hypothetical protein [Pelagicoccus albus]MBC2606665.1 hypothetical protein [Pelagicoccus albus]
MTPTASQKPSALPSRNHSTPARMARSRLTILSCFAALLLLQVACTPMFVSDFENDPVGSGPLYDVPGSPVGDTITGNDGSGDIIAHAWQPIEGLQSLKLFGPVIDNQSPFVYFNTTVNTDQSRPMYFIWKGRIDDGVTVNANVMAIDEALLRLQFYNGSVYVNSLKKGSYTTGTVHTVFISLSPDSDTYSVSMFGGADLGGPVTGSLENPDEFPHPHLSLMLELLEADYFDTYTVDSVNISRLNSPKAQSRSISKYRIPKEFREITSQIIAETLRYPNGEERVIEAVRALDDWDDESLRRMLKEATRNGTLSPEEAAWLEEILRL